MMLSGATPSFADGAIKNLSIGHYQFTEVIPDPKVPAPSILGAKYGFSNVKGFRYYLGTGLAYTLPPDVKSGETVRIKTGVAAQAGTSFQLGGNFSLSLDYKYLYIQPDVQHGDAPPQSIGIGLNIKF